MGDGGLLDNGGLPDAIRRGAECTVALGTEKSWICLLVGTDFLAVKNWQVFFVKKTSFFLVVKKPRFFRLKTRFFICFLCICFYPPKKSKAPKCLGCTKAWLLESFLIFWFHIWASKFVHPQRAPAFLPKTSAFSEIFGATLHLETLQSLRAEVLLNNIRPIDRSVVGDWCNPNPNVTANPDLLLTGNFGLEIDAALYDYFGIAFRDPDACQFEALTEAFIFKDIHV